MQGIASSNVPWGQRVKELHSCAGHQPRRIDLLLSDSWNSLLMTASSFSPLSPDRSDQGVCKTVSV